MLRQLKARNSRNKRRPKSTIYVEYELTNASTGPGRVRMTSARINSETELLIDTTDQIRVGTLMVLRFELPNKHRVIAVSRVCYARKSRGLGVEFLNLDDEDRNQIIAYIAAMRRKQAKDSVSAGPSADPEASADRILSRGEIV